MANFKTHISFGVVLGAISAIAVVSYSLTSDNTTLSLIFLAVIIGSFLPDLDSDGGTPFKTLVGGFALLTASISFLYLLEENSKDIKMLIIVPLLVFGFIKYVVGAVLKSMTHHRGIFHSVPAMFIASLFSLFLLQKFDFTNQEKVLISAAIGVGFLGHLVLDELKSATGLNGIFLKPDKSLGSALKFASRSGMVTLVVYILLFILIYLNLPVLSEAADLIN